MSSSHRLSLYALITLVAVPALAQAQQPSDPTLRIQLPTIIVNAEKQPEDAQTVPAAVTTVQQETILDAGVRHVKDASRLAPNVFVHEFSARKLSNPRMRGIGSSPANPGVTTFIDGVPQLNANSSSIELAGVEQVEFVRGPQSALFGRNSVGGIINVISQKPSLTAWTGDLSAPFGNFSSRDVRGSISGPLATGRVGVGIAAGYSARDGYTVNDLTGNMIDDRSAGFAKAQLLWAPNASWDARVIVSGERARDGDYSLQDLGAIRANPFHVSRNFEGHTNRDIMAPTVLLSYRGSAVEITSTTGIVRWTTDDETDLDYSPLPLITRSNAEKDLQFTQEVRFASPAGGSARPLSWQAGASVFTQNYEQDAVNNYAPFLLSPFLGFAVTQHTPQSSLDDVGVGAYGRGTWTMGRVDLTAGARVDYEDKTASLATFYAPAIAPPVNVAAERSFSHLSPQFAATFTAAPQATVYATVSEGYKAGGFNAAAPAGRDAYDEERSWNYEGGIKSTLLGQHLSINVAAFVIDWRDLQINVPNPFVPGQFFIGNGGGATSTGAELELMARPAAGLDLFGSLGYTRARFKTGSMSSGLDVSGHRLPNTPVYTANAGAQYARAVTGAVSMYVRGDVTAYGEQHYDEINAVSQDSYALTALRGGVRGGRLFGEAWLDNAFDTRYVPLAFAYPGLAPSGYLGEPGAPRTFGVRVGVNF